MGDNRFRRFFKENLKEMLREVASLFTGQKSARWQHLPANYLQISFQPVHPTKDSSCAADNRFFKKASSNLFPSTKHRHDLTFPPIRAYMVMQLQTHDTEVAYDLQ